MDLQFSSTCLPVFLAFFLVLLSIIIVKLTKRPTPRNSDIKQLLPLPPGPWKLPIIGNIHNLAVGSQIHQILRNLANQHGPLMHLQLGQISAIIVSSPQVAKDVLITHGTVFAQRPCVLSLEVVTYGYSDIAFAPYGDYWRQVKKICTLELLTAKRVKSFQSIREEEVTALVKSISSHEGLAVNVSEKIFPLTYGIISRAAFGKKSNKDQEMFTSIMDDIIKLGSGFSLADMYPSLGVLQLIGGLRLKLQALHQKADMILQGIIDEHRKIIMESNSGDQIGKGAAGEAKDDLVSTLLKIQQHGDLELPLTDKDIKAVIMDVFSAGGETSSTVLEWAMAEMVKNPRVLNKAQNEVRKIFHGKGDVDEASIHELKYLTLVIKETLRLHPPLTLLLPRESLEDCEINGYRIPAKTKVIVNSWAIGRDPNHWNDPETFYPERFLNSSVDFKGSNLEFIPFGAGRRICPGISFALATVELPLAALLYHFDWKLPSGLRPENLDMTESFGVATRRKDDLILIPTISSHLSAE